MKARLKGLIREETGAALVLTLVLLVLGGLILTPLMGHIGSGHIAGQVHEKRMDELYAADAGVEYAVWRIVSTNSTITEGPLDVNGKTVEVDIDDSQSRRWQITSTGITEGADGPVSSTTVTAELRSVCFADNAITSRKDVLIQSNSNVYGTVQYGGILKGEGNIHGETIPEEYDAWPEAQELYDHYYSVYVEAEDAFEYRSGNGQIQVKDFPNRPLYWDGHLDVDNKQGNAGATLRLDGTVYVRGDLDFSQPGNKNYTIDLNGQTILVEGKITFPSANPDPEKSIRITGSGSIIAVGDIDFQPSMTSNPDDFVLVLSLKGSVNFQPMGDFTGFIMSVEKGVDFKPNGDFRGSVAGDVNVDLLPNVTLTWQSIFNADIDFPFDDFSMWRLRSYNIHTETG